MNHFIKKYQENPDHLHKWNFGICETPIQKGKSVILGLNWGGDDYPPQKSYPILEKERDWSFIRSSMPYLTKYLGINEIQEINYTNLCFFRSENISVLESKDWELSFPLLNTYVNYINPPWILLLGTTGFKILKNNQLITEDLRIEVQDKNRKVLGFRGLLFSQYKFMCVPHSQAHLSNNARNKIWRKVIGE